MGDCVDNRKNQQLKKSPRNVRDNFGTGMSKHSNDLKSWPRQQELIENYDDLAEDEKRLAIRRDMVEHKRNRKN